MRKPSEYYYSSLYIKGLDVSEAVFHRVRQLHQGPRSAQKLVQDLPTSGLGLREHGALGSYRGPAELGLGLG